MPIHIIETINYAGLGLQATFKFVVNLTNPCGPMTGFFCTDTCKNPSMTTQVSVTARVEKPQNSLEKVKLVVPRTIFILCLCVHAHTCTCIVHSYVYCSFIDYTTR